MPIGRSRRCNQCLACLREDCGKCKFCKDKPKFGGKGVKKQCCIKQRCMNSKGISEKPVLKLATYATNQLTDITNTLGKIIICTDASYVTSIPYSNRYMAIII